MTLNLVLYGKLFELTGEKKLMIHDIDSTDGVIQYLVEKYPAFANATYIVAAGTEIVQSNTKLENGNTVSFLPPYSGG